MHPSHKEWAAYVLVMIAEQLCLSLSYSSLTLCATLDLLEYIDTIRRLMPSLWGFGSDRKFVNKSAFKD